MAETGQKAHALLRDRYSVIPVARDKKPALSWARFMLERADVPLVDSWYTSHTSHGIGIVCGHVSDNLLVLDVESEEAWVNLLQTIAQTSQELLELILSSSLSVTPSGGRHLLMHCDHPAPAGTVLARDSAGDVLIETRGQGHYIVAPGSPVHVHPLGIAYRWDRYFDPEERATWSLQHIAAVLQMSRSQNAHVVPAQRIDPVTRPVQQEHAGDPPGQIYCARGSWFDLLTDAGWSLAFSRGDTQYWRRPGKSDGVSATVGHCKNDRGEPMMYVFTSSAHHLEPGRAYSLFAARTALRHGGDYGECARALWQDGYRAEPIIATLNPPRPVTATPSIGSAPQAAPTPAPAQHRYLLTSEISRVSPTESWLWYGMVRRGAATMISAHPKCGKTTLISYLLKSLQDGGEFLGLTTQPARVLVLSEEDGPTIAERADIIGIGDHVGWYVRPFTTRPTMTLWKEWVAQTVQDCIEHRADILIVDTLMRNMPIRDENNATEIDDALLPLWKLMQTGVAIIIIHHLRKGGGAEGTGARGSTALMAWPEITMELSRTSPDDLDCTRRTLRSHSRFTQTPSEIIIELGDDGYTVCNSVRDSEARGVHTAIHSMLSDRGEWMTHHEIASAMGKPRQIIESHLSQMVAAGVLSRSGSGARGDIHRYGI